MTKAILIDDEKNKLDNLSGLLVQYCPAVSIVATALDAATGRELIVTS